MSDIVLATVTPVQRMMECYLALSIHGTDTFITANRRDVAKPEQAVHKGDMLTINSRQFKIARVTHNGTMLKLHAPDLEGSGLSTMGDCSRSINDAKRIFDYFQELRNEGWTVEDTKFKAKHWSDLGLERPANVPMQKSGGAYTRSTAARGDMHSRVKPPYLPILSTLGINQKNVILAVDEMLSTGATLPLNVSDVQKYASRETGKPITSFYQVFNSTAIQPFFKFDQQKMLITRFLPNTINDWVEWREEKLNPQASTALPVEQNVLHEQQPSQDEDDDKDEDNFGID